MKPLKEYNAEWRLFQVQKQVGGSLRAIGKRIGQISPRAVAGKKSPYGRGKNWYSHGKKPKRNKQKWAQKGST